MDRNAYKWPAGWKSMAEWRKLAHALLAKHGPERTREIVEGRDVETNRDLDSWRNITR